ncbi:nucleotide-diphospho-sugar transferase [Powellomyces hirtus]|nr:nucleotide-diphospho-sugar transferase [Powellomyces hirtus]
MSVVIHCFVTWNLREVNYVGLHNDGFPLNLDGLPPAPDVNITALIAARRTVAEARLTSSVPKAQIEQAKAFIFSAEKELKWGPEDPEAEMIIPPILHQIVVGMKGPTPQKWIDASDACKAIHPDWTTMTWDDAAAEEFIQKEYPWFFKTWMNYRYNIQKADSLRYLVLFTYGGTYMDMDLQCLRPLDPLRKFPFLSNAAHPVGVSNGFLMSPPKSVFVGHLVENLEYFNRFFFSAYPTVMFSTGCMYVSAQHAIYAYRNQLKTLGGDHNRINGAATTPLFRHLGASSWHQGDAKLFVQLGKILKKVPIFGSEAKNPNGGVPPTTPALPHGSTAAPTPSVPLLPFVLLSLAVVACVACFKFGYLRRRRSPRVAGSPTGCCLSPTKAVCEEKCCKTDDVVVLVSEKEAWMME